MLADPLLASDPSSFAVALSSLHLSCGSLIWGPSTTLCHYPKESGHVPARVSMPGVDVWRYMGFGVAMRASCGDAICCGVPIALCTPLAPFAMWAYPGDGTRCWSVWGGCGEDLICWLRPEGVRDGIWRLVRLPGDRSSDGDGMVGAACGVGVPAGESDGDNSELISMVYSVHDLLFRLARTAIQQLS